MTDTDSPDSPDRDDLDTASSDTASSGTGSPGTGFPDESIGGVVNAPGGGAADDDAASGTQGTDDPDAELTPSDDNETGGPSSAGDALGSETTGLDAVVGSGTLLGDEQTDDAGADPTTTEAQPEADSA